MPSNELEILKGKIALRDKEIQDLKKEKEKSQVIQKFDKTMSMRSHNPDADYLFPIPGMRNPKSTKNRKEKGANFKKECQIVEDIASMYNVSFQRLLAQGTSDIHKYVIFDSNGHFFNFKNIPTNTRNLNDDQRRIVIIDVAFLNLTHPEALILFNDYFFPQPPKWWISKMSKSGYYRVKREAVRKFVSLCILWNKTS